MHGFRIIAFSLLLTCPIAISAKDKKKILLPTDILEARTVLVVVDPDAGIAITAPNANRKALESRGLAIQTRIRRWRVGLPTTSSRSTAASERIRRITLPYGDLLGRTVCDRPGCRQWMHFEN